MLSTPPPRLVFGPGGAASSRSARFGKPDPSDPMAFGKIGGIHFGHPPFKGRSAMRALFRRFRRPADTRPPARREPVRREPVRPPAPVAHHDPRRWLAETYSRPGDRYRSLRWTRASR